MICCGCFLLVVVVVVFCVFFFFKKKRIYAFKITTVKDLAGQSVFLFYSN